MKLVEKEISLSELKLLSEKNNNRVKAVVDIEKEIMVVDAEWHSDIEKMLVEMGSEQNNLWGIIFHPDKFPNSDWIEFNSMINLRPSGGNKTKSVDDPKKQERIIVIVNKLVKK